MLKLAKTIICLTLISSQGFAFSLKEFFQTLEKKNWSDVQKDPALIVQWARMNLGASVLVNNVCDTGATFKTMVAVDVCTQYAVTSKQACMQSEGETCRAVPLNYQARRFENIREQWACAKIESKSFEISKTHQVLVCTGDIIFPKDEKSSPPYCTGYWRAKWSDYSGIYDLPIISKSQEMAEQTPRTLAFKNYIIQCK